jgi:hypothetical protein
MKKSIIAITILLIPIFIFTSQKGTDFYIHITKGTREFGL